MTHSDLSLDDLTPPRRNRILRLVIMVMMTLCGLMMAVILLSEPRVTTGLKSAVGQVSAQFSTSDALPLGSLEDLDQAATLGPLDATIAAAPTQAAEPDQPVVKPPVSRMPTSHIAVRRAGN